jgi:hypothetical protein
MGDLVQQKYNNKNNKNKRMSVYRKYEVLNIEPLAPDVENK